jgi:hypothetical protein
MKQLEGNERALRKLFEALGSTCIIAPNQLVDPIKNRLNATDASDERRKTTAKVDAIICEVVGRFWRKYPSYKPWRVAGEKCEKINARLAEEVRSRKGRKLKPLGPSALAKHLKRLAPIIKNSDERAIIK